jgi:peptide/nickel transport system permease protein
LFGVEKGTLFLFGTDNKGRDVLSRIIHGGRISLSVGLLGIAVSFLIGITVGGVSGYFGGTVDLIIQRVIEFIRSIPTLPLWMALSVSLPRTWSMEKIYFGIVVILSLVGWTGLARVVRGKFMALREEEYIMAAQLNGATEGRIIFRHMVPSFASHIIASLTLSVPGMILGETSLSFIGLGLQEPAISWGVLLKDAQRITVLANSPWLLIPGAFVIIAILCFNFVGDGLRDAADPFANV